MEPGAGAPEVAGYGPGGPVRGDHQQDQDGDVRCRIPGETLTPHVLFFPEAFRRRLSERSAFFNSLRCLPLCETQHSGLHVTARPSTAAALWIFRPDTIGMGQLHWLALECPNPVVHRMDLLVRRGCHEVFIDLLQTTSGNGCIFTTDINSQPSATCRLCHLASRTGSAHRVEDKITRVRPEQDVISCQFLRKHGGMPECVHNLRSYRFFRPHTTRCLFEPCVHSRCLLSCDSPRPVPSDKASVPVLIGRRVPCVMGGSSGNSFSSH